MAAILANIPNILLAIDSITNLTAAAGRFGAQVKQAVAEHRDLTEEEYAPIRAANDAVMASNQARLDALP